MDVLAEVLRVIRLSGAVFLLARFAAPWAITSPPGPALARMLRLRGEHCAEFHVVAEGVCWVNLPGQPPQRVSAGDIILLPHGHEHILRGAPDLKPIDVNKIIPAPPYPEMIQLEHGGQGAVTRLVCGYLHFDLRFEPLMRSLPPLLCVRRRGAATSVESLGGSGSAASALPESSRTWLENTVQYLVTESSGSNPRRDGAMLSRMTELMFLEVLRRYMDEAPENSGGWLAAMRDPQVARTLQAIHGDAARKWTVAELAHAAGISRSGLAGRFTSLVGASPMRYLTDWRMHLARNLLREEALSVAQVAARVGFDSEAAFSRAFKRDCGVAPAAWRKAEASA